MIAGTMTDQDARFAIRLAELDQMRPGHVTKFRALRDRLLALGGALIAVAQVHGDHDVPKQRCAPRRAPRAGHGPRG